MKGRRLRIGLLICLVCFIDCQAKPADMKEAAEKFQAQANQLKIKLNDLFAKYEEFNAAPKAEKDKIKQTYIKQTQTMFGEIKANEFDSLNTSFQDLLDSVDGLPSSGPIRSKVATIGDELSRSKTSFNDLDKKIAGAKISAGIEDNRGPILMQLGNIISDSTALAGLINAANANANSNKNQNTSNTNTNRNDSQGEQQGLSYGSYLVYGLLFLLAGGVIAYAVWLKLRVDQTNANILWIKDSYLAGQDNLSGRIQELRTDLHNEKKTIATLKSEGAVQSSQMARLHERVRGLEKSAAAVETPLIASRQVVENIVEPEVKAPRHKSVADYLNSVGERGIPVAASYLMPDILQKSNSDDSLYTIIEKNGQSRLAWVIPKYTRFYSSQDFTHYSAFYDCEHPSSGELWIIEPAVAQYNADSDHWNLYQKGKLQIT